MNQGFVNDGQTGASAPIFESQFVQVIDDRVAGNINFTIVPSASSIFIDFLV